MKTILRLTRHSVVSPRPAPGASEEDIAVQAESAARQMSAIARIWGDVSIVEVATFNAGADPVADVKAAIEAAGGEVVAVEVVLPPDKLSPLTGPRAGLPAIVRAKMKFGERRPEGSPPAPAIFQGYEKVIKVEVVTEEM